MGGLLTLAVLSSIEGVEPVPNTSGMVACAVPVSASIAILDSPFCLREKVS